ncbi:hypothetical protein [Actinomadura rugatobispora]|uniref:Uncharacterized protein n=1 Tax=Actinomadura rugatobispora TaxID=1994 RepID=A0ABW1A254_9ACTN|nr:hypothetical protein GCM10010200_029030 [Actinomadura rugatobispora]
MTQTPADGQGIAEFYGWAPPQIYGWDVPGCGAGGVTDSVQRAAGRVQDELETAPAGTTGSVRRLHIAGHEYRDGGLISYARRDPEGVTWRTADDTDEQVPESGT